MFEVDVTPEPEIIDLPATEEVTPEAPPEETPPVEPSDAGEIESTEAEEPGEETPAEKVDAEPEPDSEILKKMEKMEKRIGFLQRKLDKKARTPAPEAEDLTAPKAEDFDTYNEYQDALVDFKVQKGIQDYEARTAHQGGDEDLQDFIDDMLENGRKRFNDFRDVAEPTTVPITKPMLQIMRDAEFEFPEGVAYYLGRNIKEAQAISRMSPTQATRALTQIEAKVAAQTKRGGPAPKPIKKVSDAPPPVTPTGSTGIVSKDPEKMSQAEYEQWREHGGGA